MCFICILALTKRNRNMCQRDNKKNTVNLTTSKGLFWWKKPTYTSIVSFTKRTFFYVWSFFCGTFKDGTLVGKYVTFLTRKLHNHMIDTTIGVDQWISKQIKYEIYKSLINISTLSMTQSWDVSSTMRFALKYYQWGGEQILPQNYTSRSFRRLLAELFKNVTKMYDPLNCAKI